MSCFACHQTAGSVLCTVCVLIFQPFSTSLSLYTMLPTADSAAFVTASVAEDAMSPKGPHWTCAGQPKRHMATWWATPALSRNIKWYFKTIWRYYSYSIWNDSQWRNRESTVRCLFVPIKQAELASSSGSLVGLHIHWGGARCHYRVTTGILAWGVGVSPDLLQAATASTAESHLLPFLYGGQPWELRKLQYQAVDWGGIKNNPEVCQD